MIRLRKLYTHKIAGQTVEIEVGGTELKLPRTTDPIAVDTEGTGLDIFAAGWRLRTVQFGNADRAIVIPLEDEDGCAIPENREHVTKLLKQAIAGTGVVCHNATFDALSLSREGLISLEELLPKLTDTRTMAHILDPRQPQEGGIGHGLKQLCAEFVDPTAPDTQGDLTSVFRSLRLTKATGFAQIPIDNDTYLLYAGLDVILTSRLFQAIWKRVINEGFADLFKFELRVQRFLARVQYRGFKIDVDYAKQLIKDLHNEADDAKVIASNLGVLNVNAPKQVADALINTGVELTKQTKTGAWSVDSEVLDGLTKDGNPIAEAVTTAKRAMKWSTAYAEAMLNGRDETDHVHASINSLQARTARMSISNPPLQQLPSRGKNAWKIRRMVIPDEGMVLISSDYDAIEMRVFAALAGVQPMIDAIFAGEDLHNTTAGLIYGPEIKALCDRWKDAPDEDQAPPEYKDAKAKRNIAKMANFLTVYGGGAGKLAMQARIPLDEAESFLRIYHAAYPEIRKFSRYLEQKALYGEPYGCVVTPVGRRLPMDPKRMYAGLNYLIQSTAADVLKRALLRIDDAGMGHHVLLPVHDEVIAQAYEHEAERVAFRIGELMSDEVNGIPITASGGIAGHNWGAKYQ